MSYKLSNSDEGRLETLTGCYREQRGALPSTVPLLISLKFCQRKKKHHHTLGFIN